MRSFFILLFFTTCLSTGLWGQSRQQYFDGADTSVWNSIFIEIGPDTGNSWQIGPPQKTIFDTASTPPNVMVTDTVNPYPKEDSSWFQAIFPVSFLEGVKAIQWKQKLDYEYGIDGGMIEFAFANDSVWQNAFDNPNVYNFYGFDSVNVDTLPNGELGFTGTDSSWKDIWLCFEYSWIVSNYDTFLVRFTSVSDTDNTQQEGWMIDNMMAHLTLVHTIPEIEQEVYMKVFPSPSNGRVYIETRKLDEFHIIEHIEVIDIEGRTVEQYTNRPTKTFLDLGHLPNGMYVLNVRTNVQTETFKIVLQKD